MKKLLLLSALLIISIFGYTQTAITNANIQTAVDLWDSDLSAATTTYGNISDWDVSQVTDMSQLFYHLPNFNDDISNWDVINVTNMNFMFYGASSFNQPIGNWDVSSVSDMSYMFYYASSLNQDISNWDVGNVTDMVNMFGHAESFNQPIGNWDVSSVTAMGGMFYYTSAFNQPIGNWNVSKVTNMGLMFYGCSMFNQNISTWDTSSVITMDSMFRYADTFNQDISEWNIISVTQNPANGNEDLVRFNTIKTLPQGEYAPPVSVYKTDTYTNINFMHMNKTRLVMPDVDDINVGDQIKVLGNVFSGTYNADAVVIEYDQELNDNSFTTYVDIPAPYVFDNDRSGNVLLGGLKITTTNPHGISKEYASQNKRIGVHFAYPKAYNRFYTITSVDAYNVYVDEVMTQSDETIDFYKYETTSVSQNDNVYITTNEPLLTRTTVTYASNSSVIAPNNYTVSDGAIIFSKSALPESNASVEVNIIREINRSYDRFPVLTTVDHNKIRLNGVNFTCITFFLLLISSLFFKFL